MKTKKKQQLQTWLNAHVPLGINPGNQAGIIIGSLLGAILFVPTGFMTSYDYYLGGLYYDDKRTRLIDPTGTDRWAYMPTFQELYEHRLTIFGVIVLIFAALAVYNYRSHFQGSKSIYLMKRLPDKGDLRRRCLTLPALGILACIMLAAIITGLCYWTYMTLTPAVYLR